MLRRTMKVSILVPVYGVEKFIEECAVSLFGQTWQDLEYIFVDDCSPDDSIAKLREVLQRYPDRAAQVRIIRHDRNRGSGAARATLLQAATGDFVVFADSDDIMETNAVELLCQCQQQSGADIVTGAFVRLFADGSHGQPVLPWTGSKEDMLRLMLVQNTIEHHLWARLIRRSLFADHGIDFQEGINMAEDYSMMTRLLFVASSHAYINNVVTYYRENTTGTFYNWLTPRNIHSFIGANRIAGNFLKDHDPEGRYSYPFQTGLFNVRHRAMQVGLKPREIEAECHFPTKNFLFRLCRMLFFHRPVRYLMRLSYLVLKHFYVKNVKKR
ncbi:MAG: glycosyltransferase family 2 protein [Prevotella sp.]|nr:glycosyltransferase family 2 protein [Prevotella sp.]